MLIWVMKTKAKVNDSNPNDNEILKLRGQDYVPVVRNLPAVGNNYTMKQNYLKFPGYAETECFELKKAFFISSQ